MRWRQTSKLKSWQSRALRCPALFYLRILPGLSLPPCSHHKLIMDQIMDINKNGKTLYFFHDSHLISSSHIIIIIIIIIIMNRISPESWARAHQSFPERCDCWPWFSPAFTAYYMCFSARPLYLPSYTLPYLTNADSLVIQIPAITHYFLNDSKSHWKWALLSCKLCHE